MSRFLISLKKTLAASVAFALVATAPGQQAYAAAASAARGAAANAGGLGSVAAGASLNLSLGQSGSAALMPTPLSVPSVLPGFQAPSMAAPVFHPSAGVNAASSLGKTAAAQPSAQAQVSVPFAPAVSSKLNSPAQLQAPHFNSAASAASSSNKETAPAALGSVKAASEKISQASALGASAAPVLGTLFDNGARGVDAAPSSVAGRAMASRNSLNPAAALSAKNEGEQGGVENFDAPAPAPAPKKRQSLWTVLPLAVLGGVGAWFGWPLALPYVASYLPALLAANAFWTSIGVTALGVTLGLSASQRDLWREFPNELWTGARTAAVSTFRFWARFGRVFSAVLTGADTQEAMNAPLPANPFKYSVAAWPFLAAAYGLAPLAIAGGFLYFGLPLVSWTFLGAAVVFGGAPAAFAAGVLYKTVEAPISAAWRGLKQLILEFFPWLLDLYRTIRRIVADFFKFVGGFIWGGVRAGAASVAAGAMTLGRPAWALTVDQTYAGVQRFRSARRSDASRLEYVGSFGAAVAARGVQALGMLAVGLFGFIGAALGLLFAPAFMLTDAFAGGLEWAQAKGRIARLFAGWHRSASFQPVESLTDVDAAAAGAEGRAITAVAGLVRLGNAVGHAFYNALAAPVIAVVMYGRAWVHAWEFNKTGKGAWNKTAESPASADEKTAAEQVSPADELAAEPAFSEGGLAAALGFGALGSIAGAYAAYAYALPLLGWAGLPLLALSSWPIWLALAGAAVLGAFLGFAPSQWGAWSNTPARMLASAQNAAAESFRAWARRGLRCDAFILGRTLDEKLYRETPLSIAAYPALAWLPVLGGYAAAGMSFLAGGFLRLGAVAARASWQGFAVVVTADLIKRALKALKRFAEKAIPFTVGAIWGAVKGLAITAFVSAAVASRPVFLSILDKDFDSERSMFEMSTFPQTVAARLAQLIGLVLGVAAAVAGGIVGLIYGLPLTAMYAGRSATKWAGVGGRFEAFFKIWEKETLNAETARLEGLATPDFGAIEGKLTAYEGLARAGNAFNHALFAFFWGLPAAFASARRTIGHAGHAASRRDPSKSAADEAKELKKELAGLPGLYAVEWDYSEGLNITFDTQAQLDAALASGRVAAEMRGRKVSFKAFDRVDVWKDAAGESVPALADEAALYETLRQEVGTLLGIVNIVIVAGSRPQIVLHSVDAASLRSAIEAGHIRRVMHGYPVSVQLDQLNGRRTQKSAEKLAADFFSGFAGFRRATLDKEASTIRIELDGSEDLASYRDRMALPLEHVNGYHLVFAFASAAQAQEQAASAPTSADEASYELSKELGGLDGLLSIEADPAGGFKVTFETTLQAGAARDSGRVKPEFRGFPVSLWAMRLGLAGDSAEPRQQPMYKLAFPDGVETVAPAEPLKPEGFWLPLGLFVGGAALGVFAAPIILASLPLAPLSFWGYWGLTAVVSTVFGAIGLALSQPKALAAWPEGLRKSIGGGAMAAWVFWPAAGRSLQAFVTGSPEGSRLIRGAYWAWTRIATAVTGLGGLAYGLAATPVAASWLGAEAALVGIWPALKSFFSVLGRIAKRIFPFMGGLIAGAFLGVVGSVTYGALLLGRPWFEHVVFEKLDKSTLGRFLGTLVVKIIALAAGVVTGLFGVASGLLFATPYALTFMVGLAFQWGGIGGKSEQFFDLWSMGALRREMREMGKLSRSLKFDEQRDKQGRIHPAQAGVRMANIAAATAVLSFVAWIPGWTRYFASIYNAGKDLKAGKTIPEEAHYDGSRVVWDTAEDFAKNLRKWLPRLGIWGAPIYGAYLVGSTALGYAAWGALWGMLGWTLGALVLAWPVGWLIGQLLGWIFGVPAGMLVWLANQIDKEPPAPTK